MRILIATHFYPPGHLGGTEVLTMGLAQMLRDAGHDLQVVCAEDWATAPDYRIHETDELVQGVPVRRFRFNWMKAPNVFRYLYANPEVADHFSHLLDQFQPDILHITSCYSLSASIVAAARGRGIPIVLSATDFWFLCARNTLLRGDDTLCPGPEDPWSCARCMASRAKIYRWPRRVLPEPAVIALLKGVSHVSWLSNQRGLRGMLGDWEARFAFLEAARQQVDYTVTASSFLRDLFVKHGMPAERITHSAYGLDTAWARGYETKTPSAELRLGFIGQILPFKGPDLLIKAIGHLPRDLPLRVKVYGDLDKTPDYGQLLRQLAAGDSRIEFLGTFDNSRMGEVLSGIDVLVVPSTWYDFPLVIPSALATRTPVIATNLLGMNELVQHNINGLLFNRYDWCELSEAIRRLVNDPNLLPRLRTGIGPVKTVKKMAEEYMYIYAELAAGRLPLLEQPMSRRS
jgi:glycosyltransferase involved in cell wall biosynthesis